MAAKEEAEEQEQAEEEEEMCEMNLSSGQHSI